MATITLQGNPIHTNGELPAIGSQAPDFVLTAADLSDVTLADFAGKKKVLNIVPSLDTPTCALSAKKFNESAAQYDDTVFLTISADLPFAQGRFCQSESLNVIKPLSIMRSQAFSEDYGVKITDGPMAGITSRAIVVMDENNAVVYNEMVPEIADEPDYDKALAALT
ncbi:MAG: lipid hydroperoxide peroxidase [Thiotrichales bacterium]|nr:MAG: lipid hydroperoxide peroxidase [Thiotrichales bacterium]